MLGTKTKASPSLALCPDNVHHMRFALLTIWLAAAPLALAFSLTFCIANHLQCSHGVCSECAVGFSAVLFALKVVLNARSAASSVVYGFTVPTKVHYHPHVGVILQSHPLFKA